MKKVLAIVGFVIIAASIASGQSTITGPLYSPSGATANCSASIRPVLVLGSSPTVIQYQIVSGDLSGVPGGYGTPGSVLTHSALALMPGTYIAVLACSGGFGSRTYAWTVPSSGPVTIQLLMYGQNGATWARSPQTWAGTSGSWAVQ